MKCHDFAIIYQTPFSSGLVKAFLCILFIVIEAININKKYRSNDQVNEIFVNANLTLDAGKVYAVVGRSGTGKSTLLNLLGGIDRADSGQIMFDDRDLCQMNDRDLAAFRNKYIGFVFQHFYLRLERTAVDNVMLPLLFNNYTLNDARAAALDILTKLEIDSLGSRYVRDCSGGQRQRIAIARAIVCMPKLLLCDEPSGALDPQTSHDIYQLLIRLSEEHHITIVIVSHDAILNDYNITRLTIKEGKIIFATDDIV